MTSYTPDTFKSKLNINEWAEEDRPREKLLRLGAAALSDAELLAILIGSGSTRESAVDLTRRILSDCNNNLNTLGKKQIPDLISYHGMGPAKAITIVAACELGRRRRETLCEERPKLGSATAIYNFMHPLMQDLDVEEFHILLMNQQCSLIREMCISHGGITETAADVRVIMRECLLNNATVLAAIHNHPSGNLMPSSQDDELTQRIKRACDIMRVHFIDHVIVTDGAYYSYQEEGRL
jgi:DNA repair protein radC